MKIRNRMLSFMLCLGLTSSMLPNSAINASIETARLYNIKSSVLGASMYDDTYDTNEDGIVNVFDVIRTNKEVVQGESYNDLKNKVSMLEQQIQELKEEISDISNMQENSYCDLSIFRKFGVVGDSYASGELYYDGKYHDKYYNSWGQVMARKHGTVCTNYSSGGLSTRSWLTAEKGLSLLLSSEPEDIYYLALGINDYYALGETYLGSISDITSYLSYEDYGDTFYGNYGRIIEQIQNHAPNSKIVMFTCASTEELPQKFNNAIIQIANHYQVPYIVQAEDDFFQSPVYTKMAGGHPTSIGYRRHGCCF